MVDFRYSIRVRNSPAGEISEDSIKLPPKKVVNIWLSAPPREHLFQFTVVPSTTTSIISSLTLTWNGMVRYGKREEDTILTTVSSTESDPHWGY